MFWCFDGGVTSLPIPNRAIKPASGDDSLLAKVARRQNNVFENYLKKLYLLFRAFSY